jgi:hypothetical protein
MNADEKVRLFIFVTADGWNINSYFCLKLRIFVFPYDLLYIGSKCHPLHLYYPFKRSFATPPPTRNLPPVVLSFIGTRQLLEYNTYSTLTIGEWEEFTSKIHARASQEISRVL